MRVLGPADVKRSLPMDKAVEAMRAAFAAHARGDVDAPARTVLHSGDPSGATLVMPACLESAHPSILTVKVVAVFPSNPARGVPAIHGTVLASDATSGVPLALLDGTSLTAIRTAAACGLATDLLARPDSAVLAVFGSGVHARTQVQAVRAVREIREVRIFNPNRASARTMAEQLQAAETGTVRFRATTSSGEALSGADVACAATTARTPVFRDSEVPDGIHINAIGSFLPDEREVPAGTVQRARIVVDDREAALEEAGDLLMPIAAGLVGEDCIRGDLGGLVLGTCEGRCSADEVTFFKSVGLAVQDLVATEAVLQEASNRDLGREIAW